MRPLFSVESLFTRLLRTAYSAETQRTRFLQSVISRSGSAELCEALKEQSGEGDLHPRRLEMIATRHRIPLTEEGSQGMAGLIEEMEDRISSEDDGHFIEQELADFLERSAQYLLSTYRPARAVSSALGWRQATALLEANLEDGENWSNEVAGRSRRLIASPANNPRTLARR